jgi:hypothetical protein
MTTQTNEAKIIISAQDHAGAVFEKLQNRFESMFSPIQRIRSALEKPFHLAGLDNLAGQFGGLGGAMSNVPIAGALFAGGGMALATKSLVDNSIAAHEALGKLNDLSEAYKVSGKDLQVYSEVGADSSVEIENIAKAFGFLQTTIAGARGGDKSNLQVLYQVGINAKDIEGDATSVFNKISDVFKASDTEKDDALKIDLAKKIFGKAGIEMIPMLEQGGDEYINILKKMTAEGRIYTDAEIQQADALGDKWGASMRRLDGLKKQVGLATGPMLDVISSAIDTLMSGPQRAEIIETFKLLGATIAAEAPKFISFIPKMIQSVSGLFSGLRNLATHVGWDKLLFAGLILLASPFIAATIRIGASLANVAIGLFGVATRVAFFAGSGLIAATNSVRGLALAMQLLGFSAAASWGLLLAPVVVGAAIVASAAYLIYSNWDGVSSFFIGLWQSVSGAFEPLKPVFSWMGDRLGALMGWLGELTGFTSTSTTGLQDWSNAGRTAGAVVANAINGILLPVYLAIDAFKLLGASWDWFNNKEFSFKSTTFDALSKDHFANTDSQNAINTAQQAVGVVSKAGANGATGLTGTAVPVTGNATNIAALANPAISTPTLNVPQIVSSKVDIGGRLDIRIASDGKPNIERVESNNRNFDIDARAGGMYAAGA